MNYIFKIVTKDHRNKKVFSPMCVFLGAWFLTQTSQINGGGWGLGACRVLFPMPNVESRVSEALFCVRSPESCVPISRRVMGEPTIEKLEVIGKLLTDMI